MKIREFERYLHRDGGRCLHCGRQDDTLVPQHRINRGHGGSNVRDTPSNIIVMCSEANGLIEADARAAREAREHGWKLATYQDPLTTPVYDSTAGEWFFLRDDYSRVSTAFFVPERMLNSISDSE